MTTAAKTPEKIHYGDGSSVNFAAPFRFLAGALQVALIAADDTVSIQTDGVHYTVTGGDTDAGGTVTFLSAPASGFDVRIRRVTAREQGADYTPTDRFPAETHEAALDKAMMIDQEQDVKILDLQTRAIVAPDGAQGLTLDPAGLLEGDILQFNDGVLKRLDRSPFAGKFYGGDGSGRLIPSSGTGNDAALRTDLAQVDGAARIGRPGGGTAKDDLDALTPFIWRKLPTLAIDEVSGSATVNAARVNDKALELGALGGGIIRMNEMALDIDRPIMLPPKVAFEALGTSKCLITNTAAYAFRQSAIFMTGNFHPAQVQNILGDANSKALNAVGSGDTGITLATPGDAAGYVVGDTILVCDSGYYTSGAGYKVFLQMAVRKITGISGAVLYLNAPIRNAISSGFAYNLRTGTILAAPAVTGDTGLPLYVWNDAEISGLSVSTPGYWMADSATLNARYSDIEVLRARAVVYGNTFQNTEFNNVSGKFGITAAEMSLNSEGATVRNFRMAWDASMGLTGTVGMTLQENGFDNTYRNGELDVTGWTGFQEVFRSLNAVRTRFVDIRGYHGGSSFQGNVVSIGDVAPATGRQPNLDTTADVEWSGPCGRYGIIHGASTSGALVDGHYRGTPVAGEAFRFGVASNLPTARNTIAPTCRMESGGVLFLTGQTGQEVVGAYIADGALALTGSDYTTLVKNNVRGLRTSKSMARRAGTNAIGATFTMTATDDDVLVADIGSSTLRRQDEISFFARVNCSAGTAGTKTVRFKILDTGLTPVTYTPVEVVIPAATTGFVEISGRIVATQANLWSPQVTCSDAGATITKTEIVADLTVDPITLKMTAIKASGADTAVIRAASMKLDNPVQN